jgi:hypothetical protein
MRRDVEEMIVAYSEIGKLEITRKLLSEDVILDEI